MLVVASTARHSRVNSSTTLRIFSRVPLRQESYTKSKLQIWFGAVGESGIGMGGAVRTRGAEPPKRRGSPFLAQDHVDVSLEGLVPARSLSCDDGRLRASLPRHGICEVRRVILKAMGSFRATPRLDQPATQCVRRHTSCVGQQGIMSSRFQRLLERSETAGTSSTYMNMITKYSLGALVALPLFAFAVGGGLKSGLQSGEMVSAFTPSHVTGPDAGTTTCPVCKYGKTPAVQVWVNGDSPENVSKIAASLEAAIKMEGTNKLKGFLIFIKPASMTDEAIQGQLKMVAEKYRLTNVALTYVDGRKSEFVGQYKINPSADVKNTIIVYHDMKVSANFVNLKGDEKGLKSLKGAMMQACGMK